MMSSGATSSLEYWVATRPIAGQCESGDQYVVASFTNGTLVAVVDGLGHGEEAAMAAKAATAVLLAHAHEPVVALMKRCHEALRRTRGAVMSIASFNAVDNCVTWIGVGNVEGMLVPAGLPRVKPTSLVPKGGIVGDRLPTLNAVRVPLHAGDLLFFATDGLSSMFIRDLRYTEQPQQLIHQIFFQHGKTTDDALLLGARWTNADTMQGNESS